MNEKTEPRTQAEYDLDWKNKHLLSELHVMEWQRDIARAELAQQRGCHEPKPCPTTLDFVGVTLAILQAKGEYCDLPADVRVARATCVLSELATRLEQGQR